MTWAGLGASATVAIHIAKRFAGLKRNLSCVGSNHWMVALAITPVIRLLLMSTSTGSLSSLRAAEHYLWMSAWLAEVVIIFIAAGRGVDGWAFFQRLPRTIRFITGVWVAALVISTTQASAAPVLALLGCIEWLMHAAFAIAAWSLISQDAPRTERKFLGFCRVFPVVTILIGLAVLGYVLVTGISADRDWASTLPGFAHIRHTGYLFAPAMAICSIRIATDTDGGGRAVLLFAANTALCLWFGSRGPFLGLAAGLATAAFLCSSLRNRGTVWRTAAALVLGALLSVSIPSPDGQGFGGVSRVAQSSPEAGAFTSGRTAFWADTFALSTARPLFGYGARQFQFTSEIAEGTYKHPHNFLLQVVFEWGVIGGLAFVGLLLAARAIFRGRSSRSSSYPIAVAGFAAMTAMATVDGIFYYPSTLSLTILFVLVALKDANEPVGGGPLTSADTLAKMTTSQARS